jgi:hypothetical protein
MRARTEVDVTNLHIREIRGFLRLRPPVKPQGESGFTTISYRLHPSPKRH